MNSVNAFTIRGEVQNVGLRRMIQDLGRQEGRHGLVWNNEESGTVGVLANGENVDDFIAQIEARAADSRAEIEDISKSPFPAEIELPPFSRVPTEGPGEFREKLDEGIQALEGIEASNEAIQETVGAVEENTEALVEGQEDLNATTEAVGQTVTSIQESNEAIEDTTEQLVEGQQRMIEQQDELIDVLRDDG